MARWSKPIIAVATREIWSRAPQTGDAALQHFSRLTSLMHYKKSNSQHFTGLVSGDIMCTGLEYSYLFSQLTYYTSLSLFMKLRSVVFQKHPLEKACT